MQNVNIVADLMQERLIYYNKLSGWERIAPSNVPLRLRFIISFFIVDVRHVGIGIYDESECKSF